MSGYTGIGWGISEDPDGKRYIMCDGAWHLCHDDLWDVIAAGLEAMGESLTSETEENEED